MALVSIWKACIFEMLGNMFFVWIVGIASPVFTLNSPVGIGIGLAFLYGSAVAMVTFTLKPITGSCISPLITAFSMAIGKTPLVRGMAYLYAQVLGAFFGGGLVSAALGPGANTLSNGGCVINPAGNFKHGQAVALEFIAALILLILVHGVKHSVHPSQMRGYDLEPLLCGWAAGLISFCTSGFLPLDGYFGAFGFPNVCFGLAMGMLKVHQAFSWAFWVPGFAAVFFYGVLYRFLKPYADLLLV
ncbi:hypothetical protein CROQUDRAFT_685391 [Cronartium quercuum f. sp. fusiforme G11]|uniref:Aquaporin n=1 Tax=Cronartium quercuum f. sp. fusiforme G11 TaxID=708437 RepID=A0A9P6N8U0_9BASI|nr:hypothetical protein CROQUDRAFT_685391 [Cronartium quercuum f. sp. fusiforme G11]